MLYVFILRIYNRIWVFDYGLDVEKDEGSNESAEHRTCYGGKKAFGMLA